MEFSKIEQIIDEIYTTYFSEYKIELQNIKEKIKADCMVSTCEESVVALAIYRLCHEYIKYDFQDVFYKIECSIRCITSSYFSPYSYIDCPVKLMGDNIKVGGQFYIGKNVQFGNNIRLIDNKYDNIDKNISQVHDNVIICDDVKIYAESEIGENSIIKESCTIKEKIEPNCVVELTHDLQKKFSQISTRLPSQEITIYGVVPKFKNTFVVYGEGFYNPKIKLIFGGKTLDTEIAFWDKNKIIVKVKYFDAKVANNKLIIFSRGARVGINNNIGIQKTIKNLVK